MLESRRENPVWLRRFPAPGKNSHLYGQTIGLCRQQEQFSPDDFSKCWSSFLLNSLSVCDNTTSAGRLFHTLTTRLDKETILFVRTRRGCGFFLVAFFNSCFSGYPFYHILKSKHHTQNHTKPSKNSISNSHCLRKS